MKYCLIGKKLSHSYSCDIHSKKGFNYVLKELPPDGVKAFFGAREYDGFNVTIPYKKDAAQLCDVLSVEAEETGSVNIVKNSGGVVYGYNTDVRGVYYMLKRKGVSFKDKRVLIGGTGGAAQTVGYCARKGGAASVRFLSRTGEINYGNCYDIAADTEIFVNATPVGMFPFNDERPVDLSLFPRLTAVFDLIYNPFRTRLLLQAEALGLTFSDGLPMLVEQALAAEDVWLGGFHSEKDTENVLSEIRKEKYNVVLCGMPSAGKSTVGRLVATKLGRKFIDTDETITSTEGFTPAEIIETLGEKAFREKEARAVALAAKNSGAVISVGGGAVISEENVAALKQNGVIVWLKRDLNLLTAQGRPVSRNKGIAALYEERREKYERAADITVDNDGSPDKTAGEVIEKYEDTCNKRG